MPQAKSAQVNIRLTPADLGAVKEKAAAEKMPYTRWCEKAILDAAADKRKPAKDVPTYARHPSKCEHERLPEPDFGMDSSRCPDCGTKIQLAGRQLGRII